MVDIYILGLGILNIDHVTREAERALRRSNEVLYLDTGVATQTWLESLCPKVTPLFSENYVERGARLSGYHHMAAKVLEAALSHPPVSFALQGHPVVGATAPGLVVRAAELLGMKVKVLPGISAMDCLFAELLLDPVVDGLQIFEATDLLLRQRPLQTDAPALIWQVGAVESCLYKARGSRPERFSRLRGYLLEYYPPEHPVTALHAATHPLAATERHTFPLGEIEAQARLLHAGVTLFVPALGRRPIVDTSLLEVLDSEAHLWRITE
jgi:uncharacterized protein YabN with tetrapyrrole methylase and pyrophosphatase domain